MLGRNFIAKSFVGRILEGSAIWTHIWRRLSVRVVAGLKGIGVISFWWAYIVLAAAISVLHEHLITFLVLIFG